jgi:hypothetical protein
LALKACRLAWEMGDRQEKYQAGRGLLPLIP